MTACPGWKKTCAICARLSVTIPRRRAGRARSLIAAGLVFGASALRSWAYQRGLLVPPWTGVPPLDAVFVFLCCLALIMRGQPRATATAGTRGLLAAMSSIGVTVGIAAAALGLAAWVLDDPNIIKLFPAMLFTLCGASWWVAFAVTRRRWTAAACIGAFGFVFLCAVLAARPEAWLALASVLMLVVALPGWLLIRAELGR